MDLIVPKPRLKVELKTVLIILAFCGISSMSALWVAVQRAPLFFFAYAFQTESKADSIRTAGMIRKSEAVTRDTLLHYMDRQFDQVKAVMIKIPAVRQSFTRTERIRLEAQRDSLDRERIFPRPPFERIPPWTH